MGGTQLHPAASPNVIVFAGCLPLKYLSCSTSWQCILPHQKGKVLLPVLLEGSLKTHQVKRWSRKLLSNPPGLSVLFCFVFLLRSHRSPCTLWTPFQRRWSHGLLLIHHSFAGLLVFICHEHKQILQTHHIKSVLLKRHIHWWNKEKRNGN